GLPANSQTHVLMILPGITLPSLSLRWPDSMKCRISVLIRMPSPFLASLGSFRRGSSAIVCSPVACPSAAAAADGDLDELLLREERALRGLGDDDDVLRGGEADAHRGLGLARERGELEARDARTWVAVGQHQHLADVILGGHRRVDRDRQRD